MQVNAVKPVFGLTYNIGWIGFTRCFGFVSDAIEYGERAQRSGCMPSVTHALIVTGPGECVEAQMGQGVIKAPLSKYFQDQRTRIYFRKPLSLSQVTAASMARLARIKVGCKYDDLLIVEEAAADTLIGRLVNKLWHDMPHRIMCAIMQSSDEFICSMLAAYVLNAQPEYAGRGILAQPANTISPQQLFQDATVFEPFVNDCSLSTLP